MIKRAIPKSTRVFSFQTNAAGGARVEAGPVEKRAVVLAPSEVTRATQAKRAQVGLTRVAAQGVEPAPSPEVPSANLR
jgi:hypothetical protein